MIYPQNQCKKQNNGVIFQNIIKCLVNVQMANLKHK